MSAAPQDDPLSGPASAGIRPDPRFYIDEWSDEKRQLASESSKERGQYRTSRVPFWREVMRELSPMSPTTEVVVMKGTQLGATEVGNNFFFATADMAPGPSMMVFPTDGMATSHVKKKFDPAIRATPAIRKLIPKKRVRGGGNTILLKEFPGGSWELTGAGSGTAARSDTVRYLVLDDIDGFEETIIREGDVVDLFTRRTDSFGDQKKIYYNSTPTESRFSRIEKLYQESSQGRYHVPCPHCGGYQRLKWGGRDTDWGVRFDVDADGQVSDAWYQCEHCHCRIDEHHKTWMLENGFWKHKFPKRKKRGFQISSLYSPLGFVSWAQIAKEFLEAKKSEDTLRVWVNTRMGEPFEPTDAQTTREALLARCEPYEPFTAPAGALVLTCGVDTQDDRLAVSIYGWGRGEECWLILHTELDGDPAQEFVWERLDRLLLRDYPVEGSALRLRVLSAAVDTQGHRTQHVYQYCRYRHPVVMAIQGSSKRYQPVLGTKPSRRDISWQGEVIKRAVLLWSIGTDTAKDLLFSRLTITGKGPGVIHFPIGIGDEYFRQLLGERRKTRYVNGRPVTRYVVVSHDRRVEALDCWVYAYAALQRVIAEVDWDQIEAAVMSTPAQPEETERRRRPAVEDNRRW